MFVAPVFGRVEGGEIESSIPPFTSLRGKGGRGEGVKSEGGREGRRWEVREGRRGGRV